MNKALDDVRAAESRKMAQEGHKPLLKKSRGCVIKRKENLTSQQKFRLRDLLRFNLKAVRASLLKYGRHGTIAGMGHELFAHEKRVMAALRTRGYSPEVVYDIGASTGIWSECISQVIPRATFHLFEPLYNFVDFYKADMESRLGRMKNLFLHPIALADSNGVAEMFVAQDGYGSSLHDRGDIPEVKARVSVPKHRLDDYVAAKSLPPPDVMKIDCQGAEDVILRGAGELLRSVKVLFLETWLKRGYGPHTPLLWELMEWLQAQGFSLVELGERFADDKHRLYSVDAFFFSEAFLESYWLPPDA